MKKLIVIIGIVGLIALAARAAEPAKEVSFYRGGEFSIDAFGELHTQDFDAEKSAVGAGFNYFFTENLGVGAQSSVGDLHGAAIDQVSLRGIWRAPFGRHAIYAYGGATRWLQEGEWNLNLGPGYEFRFTPNVGAFVETGIDKRLTGDREATAIGRVGLRIAF